MRSNFCLAGYFRGSEEFRQTVIMNIFEIVDICKDKLGVVDFLQRQNIIHTEVQCTPCEQTYSLIKESAKLSGFVWRCPTCRRKQSVLKDSFLEGSKISPTTFLYVVFYWATEASIRITLEHLGIANNTGVDYYKFLRDICTWKLLQTPDQLDRTDVEVQRKAKAFLRRIEVKSKDMDPSYVDEFLWRERFGTPNHLAFYNILRHIAERYPCWIKVVRVTMISGPPEISEGWFNMGINKLSFLWHYAFQSNGHHLSTRKRQCHICRFRTRLGSS